MAAAAGDAGVNAAAPEHLLLGVFGGFPERKPPDDQTASVPYLSLFATFLRAAGLHSACATVLCALAGGAGAAERSVTFFPEYGCALVSLVSLGCAPEATARLHLVGPDAWAFGLRGDAFFAAPGDFVQLYAGSVPCAALSELLG